MNSIRRIARFFLVWLTLSIPFVLIFSVVQPQKGWALGLMLGVVCFLVVGLLSETWILGLHSLVDYAPRGLKRSIERVEEQLRVQGQLQVKIYRDAAPKALVLRSWGSFGTVLLSQGLVASLTESELRKLLTHCWKHLRHSETVLATMTAYLAQFLMRFSSSSWVHVFYLQAESQAQWEKRKLSPQSILSFLIFYPWFRFFLLLGRKIRHPEAEDVEIAHLTQRRLGRGYPPQVSSLQSTRCIMRARLNT